jgi:hypothetical protein
MKFLRGACDRAGYGLNARFRKGKDENGFQFMAIGGDGGGFASTGGGFCMRGVAGVDALAQSYGSQTRLAQP